MALPNVIMLDGQEMDAIRGYVRKDGSLYASKNTSIISKEGVWRSDFLLSELFGVAYDRPFATFFRNFNALLMSAMVL